MQVMAYRSNGDTSNIERVFLYKDSGATAGTEGDPIIGLTFTSTGLNISTIAHNEAAPNTDTSAATSSIEAVGTLGTYSAPTSGFVRFSEVDATDMPGLYEIQWEDARYAISSAIWLDITVSGVADLAPFHGRIYLNAIPANLTEMGGTAQSATDLKDFADAGYNPATNKVTGVLLVDTTTVTTDAQTDLDTLTAGVTLAAGAITNASLAGNMEIVFETDFATNYNQTDNAWVTNGTSFIGTGWNVGKTGYALTVAPLTAAQVNTQCDLALSDINLDHFVGTSSGIPALPAGTYLDLLQDDGTAVYSRTTDSLQAIRDHATTIKSETATIAADVVNVDGIVPAAAGDNMGTVSSVTGNVDGNVTGSVGSNLELGPAEVNAEVVDVIFTDTDAEPVKGAPGATISIADKIGFLYKAWRNRSTQTATTYSLFNDDATTVDHDSTVSDDTTTADRGEMTDGP